MTERTAAPDRAMCFVVKCMRCGASISPSRLMTHVHPVSGGFAWEAEEPCPKCGVSHFVFDHEGGETRGIASQDLKISRDCAWTWRELAGVKSRATVMYLYSPLQERRRAIVKAAVSAMKRPGFGPFIIFDAQDEPEEEILLLAERYISIPRELLCGMHGKATPSLLAERVVQSYRHELPLRPVILYAYPPFDDEDGIFLDYREPSEPFGVFPMAQLKKEMSEQPPAPEVYIGVNIP